MKRDGLPYRQSTLAAVTNGQGKFLLVNKTSYDPDQWSFPGGGLERNETAEEAVKRELSEELLTDKFEIQGRSKDQYKYEWPDDVIESRYKDNGEYFRGTDLTQFLVKFIGTNDEVVPGDGIRKVEWVDRNDLKKYLVFPNQWENAEKLIEEFV